MLVKNLGDIEAVAFDIDGTLYDQWRIHFSAILHYISHGVFFLHFGLTRHEMHGMSPQEDFSKVQAEKMARRLNCSYEHALSKLDHIVYKGLKKYFVNMPCIKDVPETFKKFKEFRHKVEKQTSKNIKTFRSDRGGEYLSNVFLDYLKEYGILSR